MGLQNLNLSKGYAFFLKSNFHTKFHQHYGIELIFCPNGFFEIETEKRYYRLKAVIIPSNLLHRFRCFKTCKILYVSPLSYLERYIAEKYDLTFSLGVVEDPPEIHCFFTEDSLMLFTKNGSDVILDERIDLCRNEIHNNLTTSSLLIEKLGEISCLSESRLAHLFKKEIGISIRQYILWNKIRRAVAYSTKESLTRSAHLAGFSDSAHFSRVFAKMFGSTPSFALKHTGEK